MALDDQIRERIKAIMTERRLRPGSVAREAGISKQNFGFFLAGRNKSMGWDKYVAVQKALGVKFLPEMPPPGSKASQILGGDPPEADWVPVPAEVDGTLSDDVQSTRTLPFIPVVDIRRLELSPEGADMFIRIKRAAHSWLVAQIADPEAFAVEIKVPHQKFAIGDKITVSPATNPLAGNWIAVQVGTKMYLAEYIEVESKIIARVSAGQFHKEFRILGTAIGRYESLI